MFQKKPPGPPPLTGDVLLQGALARLLKGDFTPVDRLLRLDPPDLRYFYAFKLAEKLNRQQVLSCATAGPSGSLLRAAHGPQWAWEVRSNAQARDLSSGQVQSFAERLAVVGQEIELLPEADPNRWALLLIVAKGKNMPLLESERLYSRLGGEHYFGAANFLDCQLKKWSGSHQKALDFAVDTAERSAEGGPLGALVAIALTEQWLYAGAFAKDQQEAARVLADPQLARLSLRAYERSLGSARLVESPYMVEPRNHQAFWFYLSKQRDPLRAELQKLGKRFTQWPWCYLGEPATAFIEARKFAGLG
ncbi:hypothetical protein JST97_18830 [bacterium]|nr:hypothetical protein [bacterium]